MLSPARSQVVCYMSTGGKGSRHLRVHHPLSARPRYHAVVGEMWEMDMFRDMLHFGLPLRATVATCSSSGVITWASSFHLPHPDVAVEDLLKGHLGAH